MRRRAPRPLAQALGPLLERLEPQSTLAAVQGVWAEVAGPLIAAHAAPIAERGGVLEVACDEAVWAAELELLGPELLERIARALERPALSGLRCRTGSSESLFSRD